MKRWSWFPVPALLLVGAAGVVALSCSHRAGGTSGREGAPGGARDPLAAFATVKTVLQSPRCVNCHPSGDAPLQGDDMHPHLQNIRRGTDGLGVGGLECSACHGDANPPDSYGPHTPPGVSTGWRLPPAQTRMVFEGLGLRALCEQLKDPARNGGKDLKALLHHVADDPLVLWGWAPGFGRKPVSMPHAEFVAAFKTWTDAGGPCGKK
jgi:hypothetical protein